MKYIEYKENKMQGTNDFPMAFYHLEPSVPRYEMPYHWHTSQEIIRVLKGSFKLTLDGTSYELKEGDIAYVQNGVSHGGTPVDCIYECVVYDIGIVQNSEIRHLVKHDCKINPTCLAMNDEIKAITNLLFNAFYVLPEGDRFQAIGALYILYGYIIRNKLYSSINNVGTVKSNQNIKFKKALKFIETHYTEAITLEDMAASADMSSKYFCRFFREMTGKTPTNYLNYYRIESACEQLQTEGKSITEAALNNGFNDISYFIKTFKKIKGVTPGNYVRRDY